MEKNKELVADAIRNARLAMWISLIFGGAFSLLSVVMISGDINISNIEIETAQTWHRVSNSASDSYPSEGMDYKLEARVVESAENTEDPADWYRDVIAAEYGDTIEIRLKVVAANAAELDPEDIRRSMLFTCSAGLELLESANEHEQLALSDGLAVDYPEETDDKHVAYLAVGTFKFTSKDWWNGKSAATIIPLNPDMVTKLEVIAPYCDVYLPLVIALVLACVAFVVVLPVSFGRQAKYLLEHPEELEEE